MAYPTGSGSEILRRGSVNQLTNTSTALAFDGTDLSTVANSTNAVPANHIVTVLNIIICEVGEADETFYIKKQGSTTDNIYLMFDQVIKSKETFVWDDKIVLIGGDKLSVNSGGTAAFDISYCYIDQDWS